MAKVPGRGRHSHAGRRPVPLVVEPARPGPGCGRPGDERTSGSERIRPGYARTAFLPLMLLLIGCFPVALRSHHVAVRRAQGRRRQAAVVPHHRREARRMVGSSVSLLLVRIMEGAMTAPGVIRAALAGEP